MTADVTDETVLARTRATREGDHGAHGMLVLTTARAMFVVDDVIAWEVPRARIPGASMHAANALWIRVDGQSRSEGFVVEDAIVSGAPWEWYLNAAPHTLSLRDRMPGEANHPLIGIDPPRDAITEWQERLGMWTVGPHVYYLDDLPEQPFDWDDIVEVVYVAIGRDDGPSWLIVARLADERWLYGNHTVQITGEIYSTLVLARSLRSLWWGALTEDDRDRVTLQITNERLEEELVELDALQQALDPNVRAHAEYRAWQIKMTRG